jgi:tRNA threonylcarbamoyl adenosine modification protein YeaZ
MLLAIDTSAGTSVAIVDRDLGVLAERSEPDTRRHAEIIGTFIEQCLAEASVTPARLSGVAVGMGPGPFTGLRVGIAAGRAFAFGAGKPVVPIVSHDAIAFGAGLTAPTLIVTDARRREVYWSVYAGLDELGLPIRTAGPSLAKPEDVPSVVPTFASLARLDALEVSAASIGLLAESLFANRRAFAANEPLYLRSPDVTISAGPKRVS